MISYIAILSMVKKFWIPIVCILSLVIIAGVCYNKGKKDCEAKMNRAVIEELVRQGEEVVRVIKEGSELRDRTSKPLTDKQASCILSNNPFKKECIK